MQTQLFFQGNFIGTFANYKAAVHHYVENLFENGQSEFCKDVVLHTDGEFCRIRSQFKGTRQRNQFMIASRFGGILFDYFKPTLSGPTNMARVTKAIRIRQEVLTIISEQFGVKIDTIKDDDTSTALGGDSLDEVECIMCLEEHFEHEVPEEDSDKWKTVGDMIKYFTNGFKNEVKPVSAQVKELDVPCIKTFAHRAEVAFKQAQFAFSSSVSKQTTKVGAAEQKAIDNAVKGSVTAITKARTIRADSLREKVAAPKRPAMLPSVQRRVLTMRARRCIASAQMLVESAIGFSRNKYYVVDVKRNRVVYGPFVRETEARRISNAQKHCIVMTGRGCRNNYMRYDTRFTPTKRPRVTSGMFAPGSAVIIGGKTTKVIRFDKKTRLVVTKIGDRDIADFGFDFNKAKPACM